MGETWKLDEMHKLDADVHTIKVIDDMGDGGFIREIAKKLGEGARERQEPYRIEFERGHLKRPNGVESDTWIELVWDRDQIAGIAIGARDDKNWTQVVTIDLTGCRKESKDED